MTISRFGVLAVGGCFLLMGCNSQPNQPSASNDTHNLAAAVADGNSQYGVDGIETVKGLHFIPADAVLTSLKNGNSFCYDLDRQSGTCTSIEQATTARKSAVVVGSTYRDNGGSTKIYGQYVIEKKGKYLCTTLTDRAIDAKSYYASYDDSGKIGPSDVVASEAANAEWHARLKRLLADEMNVERCFRYSLIPKGSSFEQFILREHAFIDGVEQATPKPTLIMVFSKTVENLRLRPAS